LKIKIIIEAKKEFERILACLVRLKLFFVYILLGERLFFDQGYVTICNADKNYV